ncbi:MAG: hypothetical protein KAH17_09430 [Bacteroidales bacterium]|nr:hypothetical protein [Bacteroidales bacterium]
MKTLLRKTLLFAGGFMLMFLVHQFYQCDAGYGEYNSYGEGTSVDTKAIHQGAVDIENAFLSGDLQQVKSLLTEEGNKLYEEAFKDASPELLQSMGDAIKTRELLTASEIFAEFSFVDEGEEYTFSMARQSDESWKVIRF